MGRFRHDGRSVGIGIGFAGRNHDIQTIAGLLDRFLESIRAGMGEEFLRAGLEADVQAQWSGRRQAKGEQQGIDIAAGRQLKTETFRQCGFADPTLGRNECDHPGADHPRWRAQPD